MLTSKRIDKYLKSAPWIRKMFEEGQKMRLDGKGPVYDLCIGNPDLEPPPLFKKMLRSLVDDDTPGQHKYMPNVGFPETRKAVSESLSRDYGIAFDPGNIVMTVGAGGAVNTALKSLLDPGDEVIVVRPYFPEYLFYIENHGGNMVLVDSKSDFGIDPEKVDQAISDKTRAVLINNPNNPTGAVYSQGALNDLGDVLRKRSETTDRPIFLIDDAPYRKIVYDMERCTSAFDAYEYTLIATSHSKDLALPGERIGFLAISPKFDDWQQVAAAAAFANRSLGFVNAPALMQRAVTRLQDTSIDLEWYRRKRDLLYKELTRMGYSVSRPSGAFYMFPEVPGGEDDIDFINKLKEMRVLVTPGSGFGQAGYFRISYCINDDVIEGALPLFEKAIDG